MANLEFHPFEDGFSINSSNMQSYPGTIGSQNQNVKDGDECVSTTGKKSSFFSLGFYQQFFDVETDQVFRRILHSAVPTSSNFIVDFVHPVPDFWGPFWISVTLVFSIAVFGNIAQYIENDGLPGKYGSDFRLVTSSASLIFIYVVLVPIILSAVLWQRKSVLPYSISDLLCAYGYSLSIFVPVSILWTLDVNWFRWALIFTAVSLSGVVLAKSIWPAFKSDPNKLIAYGSVFGVLLLHFLLALTFKVYFFDAVHPHLVPAAHASVVKLSGRTNNNSNSQVVLTDSVEGIISSTQPSNVGGPIVHPLDGVHNKLDSGDSDVPKTNPDKPKQRQRTLNPLDVTGAKSEKQDKSFNN